MSNWTAITPDHLKAAGHGIIVDRARTMAVGSIDPAVQEIAGATARVRRAISTGNILDQDTAKVPNSLLDVAVRIALFNLMARIGLPLKEDQRDTKRDDASDLKRISDQKIRVEDADTPDADGEMQPSPAPAIRKKHREFTNRSMDGI
jgi:hypothetical protein